MDEQLSYGIENFISSTEAAKLYSVTNDYIARLCRQGRLRGSLEGRVWMVDRTSLTDFFGELLIPSAQIPTIRITSREAARQYRVTNDYITRLCRQQKLSAVLEGTTWMVDQRSVREFFLKRGRQLTKYTPQAQRPLVYVQNSIAPPPPPSVPAAIPSPIGKKSLIFAGTLAAVFILLTGSATMMNASPAGRSMTASLAEVPLYQTLSHFFDLSWLFAQPAQTAQVAFQPQLILQSPAPTVQPTAAPAAAPETINNNYTYNNTYYTSNIQSPPGISEAELESKLNSLATSLQVQTTPTLMPSSGGLANSIALSQNIDQLTGTHLSNITVSGVSGLQPSDIPALPYLAVSGGALSGAIIDSDTATSYFNGPVSTAALDVATATQATSTFGGGIDLTGGCVEVNGTCLGNAAGNPGGSDTEVQFNDNGVFNGTPSFTFSTSSNTLTVSNTEVIGATTTNATTTNLYVSGDLGLGSALSVASGGTGTSSAPSYGELLVGNGIGGYSLLATSSLGIVGGGGGGSGNVSTSSQNTWSALQLFAGNASTTELSVFTTAYFGGTATSTFNSSGQLTLAGLTNSLLGVNASGQVVSTTTIGTNLLTGALGTINGQTLNAGGSITIATASSTLLGDNNTFTGTDTFNNTIVGSINGNANTATVLQTARTINGVSFDGSGNININAASSTLLANNNTWTGLNTFANASSTLTTLGTTWFSGLNNVILSTNGSGQVVATTSIGTNYLTGTLGIGNGGTGAASFTSGQLLSYNGTNFVSTSTIGNNQLLNSSFIVNGQLFNLGDTHTITAASSTLLSNNNTFSGTNSFANTTFTNATSTTFAITNLANSLLGVNANGSVVATTSIGTNFLTGNLGTINGQALTAGGSVTVTAASSTLLANNNSWTGLQQFTNASSTLTTLGTTWFNGLNNDILSTNSSGQVVATTSIGTNYLTGPLGTINGQSLNAGGSITIATASSTLLGDNNTFTGRNVFSLIHLSATSSSLLATDASGNVIATTSIGTGLLTGTLGVGNGGTGSTTLSGILLGNGTSPVQTLTVGSGLLLTGTTLSTSGSGITALGPTGQTQTGGTQILATTTSSFNGLTAGITIVGSSNTQTFTPTLTGTLDNTGLTHSTITFASPNGTLSAPGSVALGGTANFDLNLANGNWWTATQNFTNATTSGFEATSSNIYLDSFKNALLGVNASGQLVSTTTISTNLLTGALGTINGTGFSVGGSINITAASSTILGDNNTFTGNDIFKLLNLSATSSSLLATNASGEVIATTSIGTNLLTGTLGIGNGGTGAASFTSGELLSYNGTSFVSTSTIGNNQLQNSSFTVNGTLFNLGDTHTITAASSTLLSNNNTFSGNDIFSNLLTLNGGFLAGASSTLQNFTGLNATTSQATTTNFAITNLANSLLGVNANGTVVSTTTIGTNLLTGPLGTINSTNITAGGTFTITAASSTLLANNNTFSGTNAFANTTFTNATSTTFAITNLANSLLSVNANGSVVASTTIGTNLLTGALGTVNGQTLNEGGSINITAASSTLLGDNNTFSGSDIFSNLLTLNGGLAAFASSTIGNGTQAGGLTINGGATTTGLLELTVPSIAPFTNSFSEVALNDLPFITATTSSTAINDLAIGIGAFANGNSVNNFGENTVIGNYAVAAVNSDTNTVIGANASSTQNGGVVIGANAFNGGPNGIAIGSGVKNSSTDGTVIGDGNSLSNSALISMGFDAGASAQSAMAFGWGVSATAANQVVFGSRATATATPSLQLQGSTAVFTGDPLFNIATEWLPPTVNNATREGGVIFSTYDFNAQREFIRAETTGSSVVTSFNGGDVGIGTTSPYGLFSISADNGNSYPGNLLFDIASSTSSATTTLFSVSNTGGITTSLGSGFVGSNNGLLYTFASSSITAASSTLLGDNNTFSGTADIFSNLLTLTNGFLANASSTLQNFTGKNATTSQATTTNFAITNLANSLLGVNANGTVVATTTIGSNLLSASGVTPGSYTTANVTVNTQGIITSISSGSGIAASSTLLSDNNTFSGNDTFKLLNLSATSSSLLSTNASGEVVATTSIGTNLLTGTLGIGNGGTGAASFTSGELLSYNGTNFVSTSTIGNNQLQNSSFTVNGTLFNLGDTHTITAASSTLLANNNTWTGLSTFANASSTLTTLGTTWFNGLNNDILSTNGSGQVVATTTIGSNLLSVPANSLLAGNGSGQLIASTTIGWNLLKGPASSIFAFDATGNPIATTTIGTNYLTGALGTINGTPFSVGGTITVGSASTTLLGDNDAFTGNDIFKLLNLSATSSSLLATNASGEVIATTSIGTNLLTGVLGTVNGQTLTAGGSVTVTAASSTLLSNNNTWTGLNTFANASSTLTTLGTAWFNGLNSDILSTNSSGQIVATSSIGTNLLTGVLGIGNGGTGAASFTSGQLLSYNGTNFVSTSTIGNNQLQNSSFTINGTLFNLGDTHTITAASSTLLANNNTFSGSDIFSNLLVLNGGLTAYASSTIGNGTQAGGLTINGGATTTGAAYFGGNVGIGTTTPGTETIWTTGSSSVVPTFTVAGTGYFDSSLTLGNHSTSDPGVSLSINSTRQPIVINGSAFYDVANATLNIPEWINRSNGQEVDIGQPSTPANLVVSGTLTSGAFSANGTTDFDTTPNDPFLSKSLENYTLEGTGWDYPYYLHQITYTPNGLTLGSCPPGGGGDGDLVHCAAVYGLFVDTSAATSSQGQYYPAAFMGGNVGVGTTTPYARFAVESNYTDGFTPTTLFAVASSTTAGTTTLFSISNTGTINTNLDSSTTTLLTFGGQQLILADNANNDIGIGGSTLGGLIGVQNTAIGYDALQSSGNDAGENTAIGYGAAQKTQGNGNVAIGANAFNASNFSNNNLALGFESLFSQIGGGNNTAIGYQAGFNNSTGSNLLALGDAALYHSLADNNIGIGYQAGFNITTGYGNILLGNSVTANNLSTGNGNVGIGNELFFPSATANNQLNIGNLVFGTLPATSTGFQLPTTGAIGIGSSSPSALLSVFANNGLNNTTLFAIGSSTGSATTTLFSISNTGSTTAANGINITAGCFSVSGTCIGSSSASSTLLANNNTFSGNNSFTGNTTFANATTSNFAVTNLASSLLGVNANGSVVATTSIGSNLLTASGVTPGSYITANVTVNSQGIVTAISNGSGTAASSTLLSDNNTFTGNNIFKLLNLSATSSSLLATNASGEVIATTSIGTNLLTGTLATINSTNITAGGTFTITAASSTLLANNNTFSGNDIFSNTLTLTNGFVSQASSTVAGTFTTTGASTLGSTSATGGLTVTSTGQVGIGTTTPGFLLDVGLGTGPGAAYMRVNGGNNGTFGGAAFVIGNNSNTVSVIGNSSAIFGGGYVDDLSLSAGTGAPIKLFTNDTNTPRLIVTASGQVGIGTSSPLATLTVSDNTTNASTNAFLVSSSTASATTTLFSISNTGAVQTSLGSGFVGSNNGTLYTFASSTVTAASSTLLADNNTWTGLNTFANASSTLTTLGTTWFNGLNSDILSTNGSGQVVATTSIGTNYLTGTLATINSTNITAGGTFTITAASSTLLANNNTFSGNDIFSNLLTLNGGFLAGASSTLQNFTGLNATTSQATTTNFAITSLANSLLGVNANGTVVATTTIGWNLLKGPASSIFAFDASGNPVATTSIGTNYLTGALGTINGQPLNEGGSITITAASSSLLGDNNTFSGTDIFSNLLTLNGGFTAYASSTVGNGTQAGGLTINGGATTTGVAYFNTELGVGTTTPDALLSVSGNSALTIGMPTLDVEGNLVSTGQSGAGGIILNGASGGGSGGVAPGNIVIAGGNGGAKVISGSGAAGASVFISAGAGGTGPTNGPNGNILLGVNSSGRAIGNVGIGTTSPYALLTLSDNTSNANPNLFVISSSTASATTTLFSISNTGTIQTSLGSGFVGSNNGSLYTFASSSITAASSTLLANNNTFSGNDIFSNLLTLTSGFLAGASSTLQNFTAVNATTSQATTTNFAITRLANSLLAVNANGSVVATTSIGTNLLTGTLGVTNGGTGAASFTSGQLLSYNGTNFVSTSTIGNNQLQNSSFTINGTLFNLGDTHTITAASSTLLANNNTFSGTDFFSNLLALNGGLTAYASSTIGNGTQSGGLTVSGSATTTLGLNIASSTLGLSFNGSPAFQASTALGNYYIGATGVAQNSGVGNYAFGQGALQYATSSNVASNIAIGFEALQGSPTAGNLSSSDVAIGGQALTANTIGSGDNAVGEEALFSNTGGSSNNAVGFFALNLNTTGGSNNAFGDSALAANTIGVGNSAFGDAALTSLVGDESNDADQDSDFNSAFGSNALFLLQAGFGDTALGNEALENVPEATDTVAVGDQAGDSSSVQSDYGSVYLGSYAGESLTGNATYNTFVGYGAGDQVGSGYGNILLGADTSFDEDLGSGSNNIGIGNDLQFATSSASNKLNIGDLLFGSLPATSSVFELPTIGTIGIGTSTPFGKFAISLNNGDSSFFNNAFVIASSTSAATTTLFSISNTGSTTIANGVNITAGCFAVNGACIGSAAASSTLLSDNNTFTGNNIFRLLNLSATSSSLLATNASGEVIATTSIGTNLLTGPLGTVNGQTLTAGGSVTITAASSTLLGDNNTFSGSDIFSNLLTLNGGFLAGASSTLQNFTALNATTSQATTTNFAISSLSNALLGVNANGTVVATTSIGTNYLTGALGTINGTGFSVGGTINVTTASSSLLGDNNTFSGTDIFSNTLTLTNGFVSQASSTVVGTFTTTGTTTVGNGTAQGGLTINGDSTTTGDSNVIGTQTAHNFVDGSLPGNFLVYTNGAKELTNLNLTSGLVLNSGTLSISGLPVADLSADTISGVTLGGSLSNVTFNNSGTGGSSGSTYNGGSALTVSYNTVGAQVAGTYLTGLGNYATTTASAISFSTSTLTTNGQTFGLAITPSSNALLFTPTLSGTLNNGGLTHSTITINGTTFNLGDTNTITAASSTLLANNNTFSGTNSFANTTSTNATTSQATTTNFAITSLSNALLGVNASGTVVSTTTIGTNLLTGALGTINGAPLSVGGTINITAASSTLLSNNNSWTGLQQFANASSTLTTLGTTWFNGLNNDILSTNGSGQVVATTSIGTNYLTGTLATINSTNITAGGTFTITAASSTLLANNNTFSGNDIFSNLLTLTSGFLAEASSTIGNGTQAGGLTINGGATTTGNAYIAGTLGIGNAVIPGAAPQWYQTDVASGFVLPSALNVGRVVSRDLSGDNEDADILDLTQYQPSAGGASIAGIDTEPEIASTSNSSNNSLVGVLANPLDLGLGGIDTVTGGEFIADSEGAGGSGVITGGQFEAIAANTGGTNTVAGLSATANNLVGSANEVDGGVLGATNDSPAFTLNGLNITTSNASTVSFATKGIDLTTTNLGNPGSQGAYGLYSVLSNTGSTTALTGLSTQISNLGEASTSAGIVIQTANFTSAVENDTNYGLLIADQSDAGANTIVGNNYQLYSQAANPFVIKAGSGNTSVGSTSPFAEFAIAANNGSTNTTLFAIGSSTASATTTLFSISNTGSTTAANGFNITNGCFAVNGACIGSSSASSTLLANNNTFSGNDIFSNLLTLTNGFLANASSTLQNFTGKNATTSQATTTNFAITGLANSLLGVNANGTVVSTTTIGTDLLTGALGTINGTPFAVGGTINVTAASSTLLANNNTFSGNDIFSNLLTLNGGFISAASSTVGNGTQAGGLTISGGATTTGNALVSGTQTVGNLINSGVTANTLLYANGSKQESSVTLPAYVTLTSGSLAISALPVADLSADTISGVALGGNLSNVTFNNSGSGGSSGSTYNGGSALTVSYNTVGAQVAGTYLTGLGNYSTTTASAISFSTSTANFQGATFGQTIVASANGLLFTPTITGTLTAASSTLLANNNTFSGTNSFANTTFTNATTSQATTTNLAITSLSNALLGVNASGTVVSTTTIGTDLLTGALGTINGTPFAIGGTITVTAASSTLLANNDTFSGNDIFSNLLNLNGGLTAYASSTIGNGTQTGGLTINGGATTTLNAYFAGNVGVGTSTDSAKFSVQANGGQIADFANSSGTSVVHIASTGNIGLSSTTPWADVSIENDATDPGLLVANATTNATQFIVSANGLTGIGTTTPFWALTVASSTGPQIGLTDGTAGDNAWTLRSASNWLYIATSTASATSSTPAISIGSFGVSGAIGIGTTTNSSHLAVEEGALPNAFIVSNTGSTTPSFWIGGVNQNGDVGVGTSTDLASFSIQPVGGSGQIVDVANNLGTSVFHITSGGSIGIGSTSPDQALAVSGNVDLTSGHCFMVAEVCIGYVTKLQSIYATSSVGTSTVVFTGAQNSNPSFSGTTLTLPKNVSYYTVEAWGGGGGGGPATNTSVGTAGATSCYSQNGTACSTTAIVKAAGGSAGTFGATGTAGAGGTALSSVGENILAGNPGAGGSAVEGVGGNGGSAPDGGAGAFAPITTAAGGNGQAPGGGGAAGRSSTTVVGAGGGSGAYAESVASTSVTTGSTFTVGAGGAGGTGSDNGGNGGSGGIVITIYATSSPNAAGNDYAEMEPVSNPNISAGDIVAVDTGTPVSFNYAQERSNAPLAGVVSTQPGQVLGDQSATGERPVALAGRVPVKVSLENGPIAIGDRIAPSSVPGVGMKAGPFDATIGIALQSYDGTETSPQDGDTEADEVTVFLDLEQGVSINDIALNLLGGDASLFNNPYASSSAASTTEATSSAPLDFVGGMLNALAQRIGGFAFSTASSTQQLGSSTSTASTDGYTNGFLQALFGQLEQWFASAGNGIGDFFAHTVTTNEICVADSTGSSTCINKAQLDQLIAGSGGSDTSAPSGAPSSAGSASSSSSSSGSTSSSTSTPPVLEINGENPATVTVGATYEDLGAMITGPRQDLNLGIQASVDGATSTTLANVQIDTTQPGTHTITYTATDQNGLTSSVTRTVNVVAADSNSVSSATSSSEQASSTPPIVDDTSDSNSTPASNASSTDSTSTTP